MKHNINTLIYSFLVLGMIITSCTKEFLDAKPSTDIVQPFTLDEFQKLLDNSAVVGKGVGLGILSADEYRYSSDATWQSVISIKARNCYIWSKDIYEGAVLDDWDLSYSAVFYANSVLSGLEKVKITTSNSKEWNKTKGWALFVRAYAFYDLVNNFAPFYDKASASNDLGIPLRTQPSIDQKSPRSTIQETYNRILQDLTQASTLLDTGIPVARSRPSKAAAHALFARIYLNMRNYTKAESHADTCLSLYNKLIDYNTLSKTATSPFVLNHDEQIFAANANADVGYVSNGNNTYIDISPDLISLYSANDLRLVVFYNKQLNGTYDIKRGYYGSGLYPFLGLATDEVYLIKAECLARGGKASLAMNVLNQLLIKRWNPNATSPAKPFENITAFSSADALAKVLVERRKELVWRGLRWSDLKRFNKEGANITLIRTINGKSYTLLPNDPRYVFPIPDNEINLSHIPQNLR